MTIFVFPHPAHMLYSCVSSTFIHHTPLKKTSQPIVGVVPATHYPCVFNVDFLVEVSFSISTGLLKFLPPFLQLDCYGVCTSSIWPASQMKWQRFFFSPVRNLRCSRSFFNPKQAAITAALSAANMGEAVTDAKIAADEVKAHHEA
jgi:hypothetical protein